MFQPEVRYPDIMFNSEYHIRVFLVGRRDEWQGQITFYTPKCSWTSHNETRCEGGLVTPDVVYIKKTTTPYPPTTLENIGDTLEAIEKNDG